MIKIRILKRSERCGSFNINSQKTKRMLLLGISFFNEFNMVEFTREEFVQSLQNYILMAQEQAAVRSLNDDFSCIISTYVSRGKTSSTRVSPENNIDCPFGELGLIDILRKTGNNVVYKKSIPAAETIDPWIALAVIYEQASAIKK